MKFRLLTLVVILLSTTFSIAQSIDQDSIYITTDTPPYFPGCEESSNSQERQSCSLRTLYGWFSPRLVYPEKARKAQIAGKVIVSFVIEKDGSMGTVKIMKDPGGDLGLEALRVINLMAQEITWSPAIKAEQPVRYRYVLPIKFQLGNEYGEGAQETYLVFQAWGGQEVIRGMVPVEVQDKIPYILVKNIKTLDLQQSKAIYGVIGNVNIIRFKQSKLERPQELVGLKLSNRDKMTFQGLSTRIVKGSNQLNITLTKVNKRIQYFVHSYVGEVFNKGTIRKSNGIIEKVDISNANDGVLFVSFVEGDRYFTSLVVKE